MASGASIFPHLLADDNPHDASSVPHWVPELRIGVRADVYPVSPPAPASQPPELVLDRDAVTSGYAEHRPPYEFSSLLGSTAVSAPALARVRVALHDLSKAPPPVAQRQELVVPAATGGARKAFPLQKLSAKSSLEDWFNRLASGGAFSTAALSKAVPLGPAIVRAVGKVLEMMAVRGVPTQRAVWYIRIAVLNECVKQVRPDRPAPSPRIFWTRQLCGLLKTELDAFRAKRLPPQREYFWHYVLDLARWQADEALLDIAPWLERIAAGVRLEMAHGGVIGASPGSRVVLRAAETFITEFAASTVGGRRLTEALLAGVEAAGGAQVFSSPKVVAAAEESAAASMTASAVAATSAGASVGGVGEGMQTAIAPSSIFTARVAPVVRVASLLKTLLRAAGVAEARFPGVGDDDELVKLIALAEKEKTKSTAPVEGDDEEATAGVAVEEGDGKSSQSLSVLLERLPCCGDIVGVCTPLQSLFDAPGRGGSRAIVSFLCAWAVRGPMRMSPHAVAIASSCIAELAAARGGGRAGVPAFQPEIWFYVKKLDVVRSAGLGSAPGGGSLGQGSQDEAVRKDAHGYFADPDESAENARMVRLLARLFNVGQFSLSSYLKEVGRLVATSQPSARRHLLYVAALPEPADRCSADSRRALLRRGRRILGKAPVRSEADDKALAAVLNNDVEAAVVHGLRIQASGSLAISLASAEAVLGPAHDETDAPERRVFSVLGFLSSSGMQLMAVDWLLRILGGGDGNKLVADSSALCAMVYALDNLAPFVASSGSLQTCLERMCSMSAQFQNVDDGASILSALESTSASFCARFAANSGSGNASWARWVAQAAEFPGVSRRVIAALLLGNPESVSNLTDTTLSALRMSVESAGDDGFPAPSSAENCWGLTPDEDLTRMESIPSTSESLQNLASFVSFRGESDEEAAPPVLGAWVTANAVMGCVVVPEIKRALLSCNGGEDDVIHLTNVLNSSLELLREGVLEHDLYGTRSTLVVELVALLGAASLGKAGKSAGDLLYQVLAAPWVRIALLPMAGHRLLRRLRERIDSFLGEGTESPLVPQRIFETSVALFGKPLLSDDSEAVDEGVVVRLFAWVEWGVTEFLLSAIASVRDSNGDIAEFGRSIGEAAGSIRFCEEADMLMKIITRCSPEGRIGLVVEQLATATVEGLAQGMGALVAHVLVEACHDGQTVPQAEREAWAAFDAARCTMMRSISLLLEPPLESVILAVVEQLASASEKLQSPGAGELRPDLSSNGKMFSSAVESRFFVLEKLLEKCKELSPSAALDPDAELPASREKTIEAAIGIANIIASATPLLLPSALSAGLKALQVGVSLADRDGPAMLSIPAFGSGTQSEDFPEGGESEVKVSLRSRIGTLLSPVEVWLDASQQGLLRRICSRQQDSAVAAGNLMRIRARNFDGSEIDPWNLLEGYGHGADEEPAISVQAFGVQVEDINVGGSQQGKGSSADEDGVAGAKVVRLKRTFSTYASLTVR